MRYFCQSMSFFYVKICELPAVPIRCRIFDFWERVRVRKGGLSRDNVLSPGERCWKCSLLNSLSTHIKTKCLYTKCYGSSRSLTAISIFFVVNSHLVPFLHIIDSIAQSMQIILFPWDVNLMKFKHSIFTSHATLTPRIVNLFILDSEFFGVMAIMINLYWTLCSEMFLICERYLKNFWGIGAITRVKHVTMAVAKAVYTANR